jgi:pyrimidine-nucleoside phosphorylase
MQTIELIKKKQNGQHLTREELAFLVSGFCNGRIPDYQISAWLMAVFFQGMSTEETVDLTIEMANSGDTVDLSDIFGVVVDKHSTGGVGDKTTLILAPLIASLGLKIGKMSGRSLGYAGGTIDKLESIKGFNVEMTKEQFVCQMGKCGIAIMSQSENFTPGDKKLYELRDVTSTVDSIPLIASSIMSKKITTGSEIIVLDVKTGKGAFMKTLEESIELARSMVNIGCQLGKKTVAVVSNMDQPLGKAIGNALEVKEAINTLKGNGAEDIEELCYILGAIIVILAGKAKSYSEAKIMLEKAIKDGSALNKFRELVKQQNGDLRYVDNPSLFSIGTKTVDIVAPTDGYICELSAENIGCAVMELGAGRTLKNSKIDLNVGVTLEKKIGERVKKGERVATLYINDSECECVNSAKKLVEESFEIHNKSLIRKPLIQAIVTSKAVITEIEQIDKFI